MHIFYISPSKKHYLVTIIEKKKSVIQINYDDNCPTFSLPVLTDLSTIDYFFENKAPCNVPLTAKAGRNSSIHQNAELY